MKKLAWVLISIFALLVVTACSSSEQTASVDETKLIRVGFTPGPYSDQVRKGIEPILKEKGYEIEYNEFTNGNEINFALEEGSLDANIYQHTAYFENFIGQNNLNLVEMIKVPTAPMGIYSDQYTSFDNLDLNKTYKIAIPNDPPNIARALRILEEAGFLKFKQDYEPISVSTKDVEEYYVQIEFIEVEQAQLARVISDVDFALVNGNYILASDRKLSDSLLLENPPFEYQNLVAVRAEDQDKQFVKDLIAAYQTKDFQTLIETDPQFEGFWHPEYFK
ncbi:MetQ/NlpA family ABC transporter substrate-binding protein [Oceanobacillus piezotolerans]|nr:MetQ/NlpA family ABC transporter substrate-binding protein [Oceanobacillus piezotolerans]